MIDKMRTRIIRQAIRLYEEGVTISDIIKVLPKLYSKDLRENIEMIIEKSIAMTKSLMIATDQAGGSGWSADELDKMTVLDLISTLAPNHVRFVYTGKNKPPKDKHPHDYECHKKIKELAKFVDDMINEFENHIADDQNNIVAISSKDIYEEIKQLLEC